MPATDAPAPAVSAAAPRPARTRAVYVALLVVAAATLLTLAVLRLRGPGGPVLYGDLRAAPGLREGAPVSFRGIAVGQVTHIGFVRDGVRLTIALARPDVPLRRGDGVRVRRNGVFGDFAVELTPGPASAPPLRDGDVLGEAPPDSAMIRDEAFRNALLEKVGAVFRRDSGTDSARGQGKRP